MKSAGDERPALLLLEKKHIRAKKKQTGTILSVFPSLHLQERERERER